MSHRRAPAGKTASTEIIKEAVESDDEAGLLRVGVEAASAVTGSLALDSSVEMEQLSAEDRFQQEWHEARVQHWKDSPFAVGLVDRTWKDERDRTSRRNKCYGDEELNPDDSGCLCCSAYACSFIGAGRVGNMAVLRSSIEWVEEITEDDETGEMSTRRYTRPRLDCVVGESIISGLRSSLMRLIVAFRSPFMSLILTRILFGYICRSVLANDVFCYVSHYFCCFRMDFRGKNTPRETAFLS